MKTMAMRICLWFDQEAEEAAQFYTSIFSDSELGLKTYFGTEGFEHHQKPAGTLATVDFRINHMYFTALNGGPIFRFNEAISIIVECETQSEIDQYWQALSAGGEEGPCGWLKDKYGVSWQVNPRMLIEMLQTNDSEAKSRVERCLYGMKKIDIQALKDAFENRI